MPSRKGSRKYHGGMAPVDYVNKEPMLLNLAQGNDFAKYHVGQHGGMAPYPGGVDSSMLPSDLAASAKISSTLDAYNQIKGLQDGGRKNRKNRKSRKQNGGVLVPWGGRRKNSRKNRRNSRKNSRKNSRNSRKSSRKNRRNSRKSSRKNRRNSRKSSRKNRRNSRKSRRTCGQFGGSGYNFAVDAPMLVPESYKMLIPSSLSQQAGLHKEWADAANPSSMMPK